MIMLCEPWAAEMETLFILQTLRLVAMVATVKVLLRGIICLSACFAVVAAQSQTTGRIAADQGPECGRYQIRHCHRDEPGSGYYWVSRRFTVQLRQTPGGHRQRDARVTPWSLERHELPPSGRCSRSSNRHGARSNY